MPPADQPAIRTYDLGKSFGDTRAVAGLDLTVPTGGVYGLLGRNGAGKTTTVRMLATLTRPDSGSAVVLGHDVVRAAREVRARISLTGQFAALDDELTAAENLTLQARLRGYRPRAARGRAAELLASFALDEAAGRRAKALSGGMRRRLDLAASLVVRTELMFLDEPTTGLDPAGRRAVWNIIRDLTSNGGTVLLTTQYLEEADQLADRVAIIERGAVIAEGTPGELKSATGTGALRVRLADPARRADAAAVLGGRLGRAAELDADPVALSVAGVGAGRATDALAALAAAGVELAAFSLEMPSLDDVFLSLTEERMPA
jgi:ABC-2 type transport system ATP-binding protein